MKKAAVFHSVSSALHLLVMLFVPQAASAANFLRHRSHRLIKLGSGYLPGGGVGHMLFLHLEGSQIYRKGKVSCAFVSSLSLHRFDYCVAECYCVVALLCRWSTSLSPFHMLCY